MRYNSRECSMADPTKKSSWIDPSKRAGRILDDVLEEAVEEALGKDKETSSVEEELQRAPLAEVTSSRLESRVLFITKDISVLEKGSASQLHFLNISKVFNEVHILVLCGSRQAKKGVQRIEKNVWLYTTSVRYWWQQMFAAQSVAHRQLQFADGFRPDIVVALDPMESGLSGLLIAEKYDREFQVHILGDYFSEEFQKKDKHSKGRLRTASYVLNRTQSARFATETLKTQIQQKFPHIQDVGLLPRHYDIQAIFQATETETVEDVFPQFSFTILYVGKLDHKSTLFRALDASRSVLTSKNIGMVVVGDGPNKKEFQQRAEILGIKEQILFISDTSRLLSYLRSADVLMCTDVTEASDELVIKAAAAGLPLIIAETALRKDLFTDEESAFICKQDDTLEFSQKLKKFLNVNTLRLQFSTNAKEIVKSRLQEDPDAYRRAYRDSIETVFSE